MGREIGKPSAVSDERIFNAYAKTVQFANPPGSENYASIRSYGRKDLTGHGDRADRKKRSGMEGTELAKQGRPLK